jgi:hypothetical protein
MAKQIFVAGGLTGQDFSFARVLIDRVVNDEAVAALFEDPPPGGILDRWDAATLVTLSNEQSLIVTLMGQVNDLQAQLDALQNPPPP